VARWLCANPSKQVSLDSRKGTIAAGYDADLVIWDPSQEFTVTAERLHHRHKITPYEGEILTGVVQKTFLRGQKIYDGGHVGEPQGNLVLSID
jgi:allantoinase